MGGHGFGLLGMSVWKRLAWACLLLSVVWLSYFASVAEDERFQESGQPAAPAATDGPPAAGARP